VIHPDDRELLTNAVLSYQKPLIVVHGGAQRQESALAGVQAAKGEYVLVHDAARPCLSRDLVHRIISATREYNAAVPVVPMVDSVKRVSHGWAIADADRSELFCAQTPQGFRRALLLEALQRACAQGRYFADEASALLAMSNLQAKAVPGDEQNIKITTMRDLQIAECLLTAQAAP